MTEKEQLEKLIKGELTISDISPDIKIACLSAEGENITKEMINQAKISRELYELIMKDIKSKYYLPYCTCHYKDGVLYPNVRFRKSIEDS